MYFKFLFFLLLSNSLFAAVQPGQLRNKALYPYSASLKFEYYQNFPLNEFNPNIKRVVFIIHGIARNADQYFEYIREAAELSGVESETLILAPHFKQEEDPHEPSEIVWEDSGWKFGDKGLHTPVSSYEVIDSMLEDIALSGRFPSLGNIVIAGHSAGGQFVARYAAGSPIPDRMNNRLLSYVIANPSSYLYFNENRFQKGQGFLPPKTPCTDYDEYPYGIQKPNSYMSKVSETELKWRFLSRKVTIFLGIDDVLSEDLDQSCGANLQGVNRYERGKTYHQFLETLSQNIRTQLRTVPGIGHSGKLMYQSAVGRSLIFR